MSMSDTKVEIIGGLVNLALFGYASLAANDRAALLFYMASGTAGGALLGALGGKKLGLLDSGMPTISAKIVANIAVVLGIGPAALDYALRNFPEESWGLSPTSMASAVGFVLALFGTSLLIMAAPLLVKAFKALLIQIKWLPPDPPATETPTPNLAPSVTYTRESQSNRTGSTGSKD